MNSTKEKESRSNSKKSNNRSQKYNSKKTKVNIPVEPKPIRSSSVKVNSSKTKTALTQSNSNNNNNNNNHNNNNNGKTKDPPSSTTKSIQPTLASDPPKFERSNSFSLTRSLSKLITSITGSKENISKVDDESSPYKFTRSRSMILLRRTNRRSVIEPQLEQLSEETEKPPDQTDSKNRSPEVVPEEEFQFRKPIEPPSTPIFNPQENFQKRRSSSFISSFRKTLAGSTEKKKALNPKWSASLQSLQAIDNMVSYENMKFIDYDKFHNYEKNLERQLSLAHLETTPSVDVPPTSSTPTPSIDVPPTPSTSTNPVVVRRPKKGSPSSNIRFDREPSTQSAIFDSDFEHNLDRPKNLYRFSLDSRKLERLNEFSRGSMCFDLKMDALNLEDGSVGRRKRPVSFYVGSTATLRKSRSASDVVDAGAAIQMELPIGIVLSLVVLVLQLNRANGQSNINCVGQPDLTKYQDPLDCHGYFVCVGGKPFQSYCDHFEKFDEISRQCVTGKCPPCGSSNVPAPQPGSCGNRPNGDIWRDPDDCTKYFKCSCGIISSQKCGNGLVFNPNKNVCDNSIIPGCNSPSIPPATSCGCRPDGDVWSDPDDCTKYFKCSSGIISSQKCCNGLVFNPNKKVCDNSVIPGCNSPSIPPSIPPATSCGDRQHGAMWRDATDCSKFYICSWGNVVTQYCPASLVFDEIKSVCDYKENVNCGNIVRPPSNCGDRVDGEKWRDTSDCTKYYLCSSGVITSQKCSSGQRFNPILNTCDNSVVTGCNTPLPPTNCGAHAHAEMWRDTSDCTRFYVCNNGVVTTQKCRNGLVFNPSLRVCDNSVIPGCNSNPPSPCGNRQIGEMWRDTSDCTRYYICNNGAITLQQCNTGLVFNPSIGVCDNSVIPGCNSNPPSSSCGNRQNGEIWKDSSDCTRYYICNNGAITLQQCNTGLVFNPSLRVCDNSVIPGCNSNPPSSSCGSRQNGELWRDTSDCTRYYICNNGAITLQQCNTGLVFNPSLRVCDKSVIPGCNSNPPSLSCGSRQNGELWRDTSDCTRYYICNNGAITLQQCNTGLVFNPNLRVCDKSVIPGCNSVIPDSCEGVTGRQLIRDPSDCTKYFVCAGGLKLPGKCDNGFAFDSLKLACMPKDRVQCGTIPQPVPNPDIPSPNPPCTSCDNPCKGEKLYVLYRDPTNCAKVVICIAGKPVNYVCPRGKVFDLKTGACADESSVSCTAINPDAAKLCAGKKYAVFRDPSNCAQYTICAEGKYRTVQCPSGKYFDQNAGKCNDARLVNCNSAPVPSPRPSPDTCTTPFNPCDSVTGLAIFRDPTNCGRYFIFQRGTLNTFNCPNGKFFDLTTSKCERAELVNCDVKCSNAPSPVVPSPVVPSPIVPSPIVPSPIVPSPVIPSPTPSNTDNIKDGQVDPSIKDCYGKVNGSRFRSKSHCRIYYICRNLQAVKASCPQGQWFDDVAFVCNFQQLVKCPAGVN